MKLLSAIIGPLPQTTAEIKEGKQAIFWLIMLCLVFAALGNLTGVLKTEKHSPTRPTELDYFNAAVQRTVQQNHADYERWGFGK